MAMQSTTAFTRPGIFFHEKALPIAPDLPPMDVAAFVGFAERGPLDTPVAIEDVDVFRTVFGRDLALARHPGNTERASANALQGVRYASLPSAVTHFFANGGRRCYVVRVAGATAEAARFCLPGLVSLGQLADGAITLSPNPARMAISASSPGRWAKALRVATQLHVAPLPASAFELIAPAVLSWRTDGRNTSIIDGELLQLTLENEAGPRLLLVRSVEGDSTAIDTGSEPETAQIATLTIQHQWRLAPTAGALDPALEIASPSGQQEIAVGTLGEIVLLTCEGSQALLPNADLVWRTGAGDAGFSLRSLLTDSPAPLLPAIGRGDVLQARLTLAGREAGEAILLLLPVEEVRSSLQDLASPSLEALLTSPLEEELDIRLGTLLEVMAPDISASPLSAITSVERLRFDLLLQEGDSQRTFLRDLGFYHSHDRFWGDLLLLESSPLYSAQTDTGRAAEAAAFFRARQRPERSPGLEATGLVDVVAWAGRLSPVTVEERENVFLPVGMVSLLTADDLRGALSDSQGDDGLSEFGAELFLDRVLVPTVAVQSRSGAALRQQATERYYLQNQRLFGVHSLFPIDEVALIAAPDAIHISWTPAPVLPPDPVVEPPPPPPRDESRFHTCTVAEDLAAATPAINPIDRQIPDLTAQDDPLPVLPDARLLDRTADFGTAYASLIELHQGLINLGQARRDVVVILSLPEHFEKGQCLAWSSSLRARLGLPARGGAYRGVGDLVDLSYAAVYHPWLHVVDPGANIANQLRTVPPDGAACGMIAARALARGAWIAPANVALRNVLGLQPSIADDDWADLFAQGLNLVRAEPRDFRAMSAHTLSDEREWQQLSVRRLLILLRKVTAERGMDYVFENNGERLQNSIQLVLERLLQALFARGAFAGATPQQSYRIVTDQQVNRTQERDNGRFIAEIQVAPSQPMEFITVRFVRTVDGSVHATEVR